MISIKELKFQKEIGKGIYRGALIKDSLSKKAKINYCSRCLYPSNHPLGIIFDSKGVCSGCRIHEEKDILNWDSRFEKLRGIL